MRLRVFVPVAALAFTLPLGACGTGKDSAATQPAATATQPRAASTAPAPGTQSTLRIYLVGGEKMTPVARAIPTTKQIAAAAIRMLLKGPTAQERSAGLTSAIPADTRLLGVAIAGGTATVDLSREFESGGGSLSMTSRVAQIVTTLTAFPSVHRVGFRLEGKPVEAIGGEGVIVSPPRTRADVEGSLPRILVETPLPGDHVGSPLRISGSANTFEATFVIELLRDDGTRLAKKVVTATSGSGERGTFGVTLTFKQPPSGRRLTLYAYEPSAKDGHPLHEIRIQLVAL